jgi:multiple sugar transport system permease protein
MRAQMNQPPLSRRFARDILPALIFLLPGFALFITFMLGPMAYSLRMSFFDWNLANPEQSAWVGLGNYLRALNDPIFRRSVINTLVYTVITVAAQMIIGLYVAILLNQNIRGRAFFRLSYYFPVITSWVIVSVLFEYLFNGQAGLVNYLLRDVLRWTETNIRWFIDPQLIFVPMTLLATWKGVG